MTRHPLILRQELILLRKQMSEEWLIRHQPDTRDVTRYREREPHKHPKPVAFGRRNDLH